MCLFVFCGQVCTKSIVCCTSNQFGVSVQSLVQSLKPRQRTRIALLLVVSGSTLTYAALESHKKVITFIST